MVVEKQQGIAVHIHESPEDLRIYVPRDKRDYGACFQTKLPQRLCEWLMTDPTTQIIDKVSDEATRVVLSVLNAAPYSLSGILSQCGITTIDLLPDESEYGVDGSSDDELNGEDGSSKDTGDLIDAGIAEDSMLRPELYPFRERPLDADEGEITENEDDNLTTPSPAAHTTTAYHGMARQSYDRLVPFNRSGFPDDAGVDRDYLAMLTKVVISARRGEFPSTGPFNMSLVQAAIPHDADSFHNLDTPLRLQSASRIEHDLKVGAAGELYVSNMLTTFCYGGERAADRRCTHRSLSSYPDLTRSCQAFRERTGRAPSGNT